MSDYKSVVDELNRRLEVFNDDFDKSEMKWYYFMLEQSYFDGADVSVINLYDSGADNKIRVYHSLLNYDCIENEEGIINDAIEVLEIELEKMKRLVERIKVK